MRALLAALAALLLSVMPVKAAAAISINATAPHFADIVTFTVTGLPNKYDCTGHLKCARVDVVCYQGSDRVFNWTIDLGQARGDGTSPLRIDGLQLGWPGSRWYDIGGGPADCTVELFRTDYSGQEQTHITLATSTFHVEG
jgi:hypothetical protein